MQNVYGVVELTQVRYPDLVDLTSLTTDDLTQAEISMLANLVLPQGRRYRPTSAVSRSDMAEVFVRGGCVPEYLAGSAMFSDVRDLTTRNSVESAQSNPGGKLFFDAVAGGRFNPNDPATKLVAAVAYVRAAGLTSEVSTATLPAGMTDALSIPSEWRGYVAVALRHGFIALDGNSFDPGRATTRLELARAMNAIVAQP
jgi:hypothetical protein